MNQSTNAQNTLLNIVDVIKKIDNMPKNNACTVILVGKSASGKSSLVKYISDNFRYEKVVLHTTRPIRDGEQNGIDYYYIGDSDFDDMTRDGEFLETTEYRGWKYGISKNEIEEKKACILATDIVGLRNLKRSGVKNISIFIERNDKDRFVSSILRGDNILEVALRNERDTACYQNVYSETDFVVQNNGGIEETATKILECIGEYLNK